MRLQAITPKRPIARGNALAELRKAVDQTRGPIEKDLQAITATWETKVRWRVRFFDEGGKLVLTVTTTNKIFQYVDEGTKPHLIQPKRASRLFFQTGYTAKTRKGFLGSVQGGAKGDWVAAKVVHHPGTEARGFTEALVKKHQRTFMQNVRAAMARIVR